MNNNDNQFGIGRVAGYGAIGMTGVAILGRKTLPLQDMFARRAIKHEAAYAAEHPDYVPKTWMNDILNRKNMAGGFWKHMSTWENMPAGSSGVPILGGLYDEVKNFGFKKRTVNSVDMAFHEMHGMDLAKDSMIRKGPLALGFAAMTLNTEVDEHGISGLASAPIKEGLGLLGGRVGMAAGSSIGQMLSGGSAIGAFGGMLVGGAALGMIGYSLVDKVREMSDTGRKWSTPDLGGSFKDSQFSQTMRQRSLNAIRTSQFNVRSELGNEAIRLAGL